jgi:hypothetical protein
MGARKTIDKLVVDRVGVDVHAIERRIATGRARTPRWRRHLSARALHTKRARQAAYITDKPTNDSPFAGFDQQDTHSATQRQADTGPSTSLVAELMGAQRNVGSHRRSL